MLLCATFKQLLTAKDSHDRPLFDKLLCCLVSSPIFVARKIAELFSSNRAISQFYEACGIDDVSRGSALCRLLLASEVFGTIQQAIVATFMQSQF